ncbi:MAG: sterol desaturase family protein [Chitinophagaceae bacterium]|nr:sterol desaturase family protein [Chitinophagaceae bacterium]
MWQQVLDYFGTLEQRPLERMLFLVAGMLTLWLIEGAIPLLSLQYKKNKLRHATVNFSFTVMHLIIHTGFAVVIILLADFCKATGFGLSQWFNASSFWTIIITFFVLDFFGGWLVHLVQHKTWFLWRFHIVHHSDNNVDVTTGLRHHPIESVLRGIFFMAGVLVAGAPIYAVMIYQTILIIAVQFTHANISLPKWLDKFASFIIVSPNMHKVHHHWQRPFTDSNYGAVLAIWDRMFGTYQQLDPSQIRYGLDRHYPNEQDENFIMLLRKPFGKLE